MSGGSVELPAETLALLRSMGLACAPSADRVLLPNGDPARDPAQVHELRPSAAADALAVLARDGVVRVDDVLSAALCDECSLAVCSALARAVAAGRDAYSPARDTDFGNVDEPGKRWDLYLDHDAPTAGGQTFRASLSSLLGDALAPLRLLFDALFDGRDAAFYELAALVSDRGAASQRVHPDAVHQPQCPLYTVFVALQDIDAAMGCTHFIKGSHTRVAHHSLRHTREDYLAAAQYSQATLRRGDAVVMDARLFHFGGANEARRRKLLYFTLLHPSFDSAPGVGSKLDSLHLNLHDIQPPACVA
jgi:hypothetical protein